MTILQQYVDGFLAGIGLWIAAALSFRALWLWRRR